MRELHRQNKDVVDEIAESYLGWIEASAKLPMSRAMAISLFCTNKMNRSDEEYPMDAQQLSGWVERYGDPLIENQERFPQLFDTKELKAIVFACPSTLEKLKPARDFIAEI